MDDSKERLQESYKACLKNYEVWDAKKSNTEARENLQEAIHDIRKVVSRLEIEIAISERENITGKPLPIPSHRSSSKSKGAIESILPDEGNTVGNSISNNGGGRKDGGARKSRGRRPAPRRKSE